MSKRAYKLHLSVFYVVLILFIGLSINKLIDSILLTQQRVNACYMVMYGEIEDDDLTKECWPYDYE